MLFGIQSISFITLPIYDRLLYFREICVDSVLAQILGAFFVVGSLFVSIVLFVYWGSCACRILAANDLELTDEEIEPMRWGRKFRAQLWRLFHAKGLSLP